MPKSVTHPAEYANAEFSTENMDVQPSRGIKSLLSHDINNEQHLRFNCFAKEMTQRTDWIGTRSEPPSLTEKNYDFEKDWLDERLDLDLAWYMAANQGNDDEREMPPFGSWTVFNSMVANKRIIQSDLDYFPVIPYPPNECVLKDYLDFLLDLKMDLEDITNNMEAGRQIQWNHQHIGGFHIPLVNLKILYNKYDLLVLKGWWVKSNIIADESVNKASKGRHYYLHSVNKTTLAT